LATVVAVGDDTDGPDPGERPARTSTAPDAPGPPDPTGAGRPAVREAIVEDRHPTGPGHHPEEPRPDACGHEGWYWSPDPAHAGHAPYSVWCGRPVGHPGPHEARTGLSLNDHRVRVLQWDDV
jgi:hypothetical protein